MIDIHRMFGVWFASPRITPARKLSFADDTRSRLAANNSGGEFDLILPPLDAAITAAGGANSSEAVALAVRKAAVQAKRILLEQIKDTISRRSGRISDGFGKDSPAYTEFFPQGVTAYRNMTEPEVVPALDTLIAAGVTHDPALAAEFGGLRTEWITAKNAADAKIAAVSAIDGDQDAALAALDLVLMKVVFTAALAFTGNMAMGPVLFDQSKLYAPGQSPEPEPPEPEP
jgi:hypothetical protein